jgi:flavin reductase (DIM6/NTAB) family NADH-FMN oxidoreductase RutF
MSKTYISKALRQLVRERALYCCEYCLIPESAVLIAHEVDHVIAEKHGGLTEEDNLALSCTICNKYKGSDVASVAPDTKAITPLFNPRTDRWSDHFQMVGSQFLSLTTVGAVTISAAGIPNLAPFSFYNAVAGFPPTIMFSVSYRRREPKEKDTLRNIKQVGEFVSHIVDEAGMTAMLKTAVEYDYEINEFDMANLKTLGSVDVRPPRIAGVPVAMECQVTQIVPVEGATNVMVLGQVLRFHVQENLYRPELGLVDTMKMKPVTRLGGAIEYTKIGELMTPR